MYHHASSNRVVVTVSLKSVCGLPVTNMDSKHFKLQSKNAQEIFCDVKVEEHTNGCYQISYHPKERKNHNVQVTWNDTVLSREEIDISFVRDYTTIQQEVLIIDKYGGSNFNSPWHVINGSNNELIVCDFSNRQLVVFNDKLQYLHTIGGKGKLGLPGGVAVDNKGHLYVSDCSADFNCIKKFKMDGSFVKRFGTFGSAESQFKTPNGLVVSKTEQLYVCDRYNNRIQVFQNDNFMLMFGRKGSQPGALQSPTGVTMNNTGTQLFVADSGNHRIQVFTPDGKFVCIFGKFTNIPYKLSSPYSIYYTPDDHLLVTSTTDVVLVLENNGTFLTAIKGKGRFMRPTSIYVGSRMFLLI